MENQKLQQRSNCKLAFCNCCGVLCKKSEDSNTSSPRDQQYASSILTRLEHAMVQLKLGQTILRETYYKAARQINREERKSKGKGIAKFIVMVAMEKYSYDPREDFRESIVEIIVANQLREVKDLDRLLNYYISMNSQEYHAVILQVFHDVCSNLFLRHK